MAIYQPARRPSWAICHIFARPRHLGQGPYTHIATQELVTIKPDQDVDVVRQLMAQHELDRILVVEGDRLVGIISEADIRSDEAPLA